MDCTTIARPEARMEDLLHQFVNLNTALLALVYEVPFELPDVFPRRLAPYGGISKAVRFVFVGQPSPPGPTASAQVRLASHKLRQWLQSGLLLHACSPLATLADACSPWLASQS
jgi:hypothetical protein